MTDSPPQLDGASKIWTNLGKVELDPACMARNRIIMGLHNPASAEMAYNMLRTRLIKRMRDNKWSSIVLTSPNSGAGKSVTAINLAASVAREPNQTAYLIDLDLREPSLHDYLGVKPQSDLTAYLNGHAEITDVLAYAGIPKLYFGFSTVPQQHSADLLASRRMGQFVEEVKTRDPHGLILYDAPPVLEADDVLAFAPQFDAVILIVAEGETKRDDLRKSIDILSDINIAGVVLNKSLSVLEKSVYY
ncbi:MAG: CpsD/CapB family tyrosine-protein kinase [Gammaproteobacteria bacterium]|nr:CpsD/CapB family tyrosine-protein kinase [Gammaproteobacteria bacterium]